MTTCLITGANRGIGLELARLYAEGGARVIAAVRDPANATALMALKAAYPRVDIVAFDVTSAGSAAAIREWLGTTPLDLLVANAGVIGPRGGYSDAGNEAELWARVLATNVTGVFLTVAAFAPNVIAASGGKIAIVSSRMASSKSAGGGSYLYRASKAAAANLGANFAVEFRPKGVAVGVYHPGWVQTDMGGAAADIPVAVSAAGLVQRFAHLSLASTGVFEDYAGAPIAY